MKIYLNVLVWLIFILPCDGFYLIPLITFRQGCLCTTIDTQLKLMQPVYHTVEAGSTHQENQTQYEVPVTKVHRIILLRWRRWSEWSRFDSVIIGCRFLQSVVYISLIMLYWLNYTLIACYNIMVLFTYHFPVMGCNASSLFIYSCTFTQEDRRAFKTCPCLLCIFVMVVA